MNAPAQGTAEWLAERAGHATASRFKDVLAKIKSGEAADRAKYRMQIVTERLTGLPVETFTNTAMQHGTDMEPFAREAYETETGELVQQVGFLKHPTIAWCGASPDGFVGNDGGIEIKCPYVSTVHVETLDKGMPKAHMPQIQGVMAVSGRKWVDFVSFDPRMPEHLRLHVERIKRDDGYIEALETEIRAFLKETEALYARLMGRAPLAQSIPADALGTQA